MRCYETSNTDTWNIYIAQKAKGDAFETKDDGMSNIQTEIPELKRYLVLFFFFS